MDKLQINEFLTTNFHKLVDMSEFGVNILKIGLKVLKF